MEQKVIEIARGVAKTSTFATKNEALRFAKSEGGAAIGIYENGGMYMFAFGAYKPQMVYSKLVYELKKSYNTGVQRTYTTDDGVFVAYMPLRKKMRRHGHGSPVPPPPPPGTDIVFIGDENADLLGVGHDLLWDGEEEVLSAFVFVKSTAYGKISQHVIEVDGTQIAVTELLKIAISELKEEEPSVVIPQGFGDSDYYIIYSAANVEDIAEGEKAKVVLIDSEGEEFAQTVEKEIYIAAEPDYLSFTGEAENAKLMMSVYAEGEAPELPNIQYSTNKTNWHPVGFSAVGSGLYTSQEFALELNETIYFKGSNPDGLTVLDSETGDLVRGFNFVIEDGAISAGGDVGTLTDGVGGAGVTLTDGCYFFMFQSCTSLTSAPALPATTLADGCYYAMFGDCTSLTSAPALPATTLADSCYYAMFGDCTFDMSDNGTTFNFNFGAVLPQTVMAQDPETGEPMELTLETHKDVALWMGNTNGFN